MKDSTEKNQDLGKGQDQVQDKDKDQVQDQVQDEVQDDIQDKKKEKGFIGRALDKVKKMAPLLMLAALFMAIGGPIGIALSFLFVLLAFKKPLVKMAKSIYKKLRVRKKEKLELQEEKKEKHEEKLEKHEEKKEQEALALAEELHVEPEKTQEEVRKQDQNLKPDNEAQDRGVTTNSIELTKDELSKMPAEHRINEKGVNTKIEVVPDSNLKSTPDLSLVKPQLHKNSFEGLTRSSVELSKPAERRRTLKRKSATKVNNKSTIKIRSPK